MTKSLLIYNAFKTGARFLRVRMNEVNDSFCSCYAIARLPLILFINTEHKNTIIKLKISVTDNDSKLAQPPIEKILKGHGTMAAAPHTTVPGITQTDKNIFRYSVKFNLIVRISTITETKSHANMIKGLLNKKPIKTNG